jgi:hypothetical protein
LGERGVTRVARNCLNMDSMDSVDVVAVGAGVGMSVAEPC